MRLNPEPFEYIKQRKQKYETRVLDEKRQKINIGDTIIFYKRPEQKESITVDVINIIKAKNFEELYSKLDPKDANWPATYTPKDCAESMLQFYSLEEQLEYGVVSYEIKVQS